MAAELRNGIRIDLDRADLGSATRRILSRRTGQNLTTVKAELEACRRCERAYDDLLVATG